jgi:predicted nicotinamide N-methyase
MLAKKRKKTNIKAFGIQLLLSSHPEIRKLKKIYKPSVHGHKSWNASWLLIDFIKRNHLNSKSKVLEIGCGWGLSGIYCAKKYDVIVTATDIDPDIYPYLNLHARINRVDIEYQNIGFDEIRSNLLRNVNLLIGSDICFWENLIDPLRRLIQRAKRASVDRILIADPGRPTFNDLSELYMSKRGVELLEREIMNPYLVSGKILKIENRK